MRNKDYYVATKNIEKIFSRRYTNLLDMFLFSKVKSKLKGLNYKVYFPYKESEKVIIYRKRKPKIRLLEIGSLETLRHNEIMGSLYGLGFDKEYFWDIVIYNNSYYIYDYELFIF